MGLLEVILGGTCYGSDVIVCNGRGLKEGISVVGRIVIFEVCNGEHGIGLSDIQRVDDVGGGVFPG